MQRYLAELVGTFVLVVGGCGSAVLAGEHIGYVGIAIAFGLSLLAMVYTIGPISGCHINPAVTLGVLLSGKIRAADAAAYAAFQIIGAVLGAAVVWYVASGVAGGYDPSIGGLAANGYAEHSPDGYSLPAAGVAEIVLTFVLVLTVLGATDIKAPVGFAGIAIGWVLTLVHLIGIPITNTSVNPARSIGPAVFVGGWALQQLWLFIVAPLIGAAIAAAIYRTLRVSRAIVSTRESEQALPSEQRERPAR